MIEFKKAEQKYKNGERGIVHVSFALEEGEFTCVTGGTGAGKTTLIKLLTGEVKTSGGSVHYMGKEIRRLKGRELACYRRNLGIIFQDHRLLPLKTVEENTALVLEAAGIGKRERSAEVRRALELAGLQHKAHSYPKELSGGEKQLAAAARAVVNRPRLLLADEPAAWLDERSAREMMNLLEQVHAEGTTVLMATHNQDLAAGRRILTLKEGRLAGDTGRRGKYSDPLYA